jgi:hypothetical protein
MYGTTIPTATGNISSAPKGCYVGGADAVPETPSLKCWITVLGSLLGAFESLLHPSLSVRQCGALSFLLFLLCAGLGLK